MGIALIVALVVISLGVHEAAHAWTALKCGDPTARNLGRITLNPIPHIDPFMTILLPLFMLMTMGIAFGGAKPVPVVFHNLRRPHRDMALVALAGPASNVLLAILFMFVWKVMVQYGIWQPDELGAVVLEITVAINLLLAVFNMIPIPPLDGSRVMAWLLPPGVRQPYASLERFGILIVIGVIYLVPHTRRLILEAIDFLWGIVAWIVSFGGAW